MEKTYGRYRLSAGLLVSSAGTLAANVTAVAGNSASDSGVSWGPSIGTVTLRMLVLVAVVNTVVSVWRAENGHRVRHNAKSALDAWWMLAGCI